MALAPSGLAPVAQQLCLSGKLMVYLDASDLLPELLVSGRRQLSLTL